VTTFTIFTAATPHRPLPWWLAWAGFLYGLVVLLVGTAPALDPGLRLQLAFHSTLLPLGTLVLCASFVIARTPMMPLRRRAWVVLTIWLALKLAVTLVVVVAAQPGIRPPPMVNLAHFIALTPIGMLSLFYFYRDVGGALARPGVLLDAAALTLGGCAAVYVLVIGPGHEPHVGLGNADELALTLALIFPAVLTGLVYTHLPDMSADRGLLLLLAAALLGLGGDLAMMRADAVEPLKFTLIFSLCYIFGCATIMAALAFEGRRLSVPPLPSEQRYSLLPAVVVLGGVLATMSVAFGRSLLQHPVAPLLLALAALILVAREVLSRGEQRRRVRQEQELFDSFEVARRERAALSGRIHEELAQEIAGVQYVLNSTRRGPASEGSAVKIAVQQLGLSVAHAQEIATQLAPPAPAEVERDRR
jgi:hypothetical protein